MNKINQPPEEVQNSEQTPPQEQNQTPGLQTQEDPTPYSIIADLSKKFVIVLGNSNPELVQKDYSIDIFLDKVLIQEYFSKLFSIEKYLETLSKESELNKENITLYFSHLTSLTMTLSKIVEEISEISLLQPFLPTYKKLIKVGLSDLTTFEEDELKMENFSSYNLKKIPDEDEQLEKIKELLKEVILRPRLKIYSKIYKLIDDIEIATLI
jgi:hypothetical protein